MIKDSIQPSRGGCQGGEHPLLDLAASNEIDGAAAEIIDAFEQARLVRSHCTDPEIRESMERIRKSLTMALRHVAPFAFHAERWLGDEVENWPSEAHR